METQVILRGYKKKYSCSVIPHKKRKMFSFDRPLLKKLVVSVLFISYVEEDIASQTFKSVFMFSSIPFKWFRYMSN